MTTVFLDAVFKLFFFKVVHDTGQQLTIDRTNFLTDGFLQLIQRTGVVSVNTRFHIPQKKKSHVERSGERGGHDTSPKREMRCPGNMFRTMVIDQVSIVTEVANPEEKNADHLVSPSASLLGTTHSKDVRFPWVTLYVVIHQRKY